MLIRVTLLPTNWHWVQNLSDRTFNLPFPPLATFHLRCYLFDSLLTFSYSDPFSAISLAPTSKSHCFKFLARAVATLDDQELHCFVSANIGRKMISSPYHPPNNVLASFLSTNNGRGHHLGIYVMWIMPITKGPIQVPIGFLLPTAGRKLFHLHLFVPVLGSIIYKSNSRIKIPAYLQENRVCTSTIFQQGTLINKARRNLPTFH